MARVNKKMVLFLGFVLIMTIVAAQVLLTRDVQVEYDKNVTDILKTRQITSPQTTPIICDATVCRYSMYQIYTENRSRIVFNHSADPVTNKTEYYLATVKYNLGKHELSANSTTAKIEARQEAQIRDWLEAYAKVLSDRDANQSTSEIISNSTRITIKERR